jgi:hypothetical protein
MSRICCRNDLSTILKSLRELGNFVQSYTELIFSDPYQMFSTRHPRHNRPYFEKEAQVKLCLILYIFNYPVLPEWLVFLP